MYDSRKEFEFCHDLGIESYIRLRRNATLRPSGMGKARPMAAIDQLGGDDPDTEALYATPKGRRNLYQKTWNAIARYGHKAGLVSFKVLSGDRSTRCALRNLY